MSKKWVGLGFLLAMATLSLGLVVLGCSSGATKTDSPATTTATVATTLNLPVTTTASVGSMPTASPDTTEPDTSSTTQAQATSAGTASTAPAAGILAKGLNMLSSGVSWSYEPRGDVTGDERVGGQLIYAVIPKIASDGSWLTFDACQLYEGSPQAEEEFAKDGNTGDLESTGWVRNKYKHLQTAPIAPEVGIILQAGEVPDAQAVPLDPEAELPLISATRQQFADIFHTGDADSDQIMAARGFWMLIDKGVITEIFEPYEE